jgi:hypothetical protein
MGDSVQRWQGRTPLAAARLMRRLQNEAQMVLHDHPVNLARAARGELTVNSLWLDHAGAADEAGTSLATDATARLGQVHVERWATCDHALQAWVAAAMAADAGPQSGANVRPGTGSDPGPNSRPTLVLCGRCTTQAFQIRPTPRGWRGVLTRIAGRPARPQALQAWLQQIDQFPSEGAST